MRAEKRKLSFALFDPAWLCAYCCSAHVPELLKDIAITYFGIINKFKQIGNLANTESVNKENRLYTYD